jgi:hypothetical protein
VSPQLAAQYAKTGWLVRLGQGAYAFPGDEIAAHGSVKFLQHRVPGLHIGGKSALALQGVRHNLGDRAMLVLWGDDRFALPPWFTARFPAHYVAARLFDWPADRSLEDLTLTTPPGVADGLRVSTPERAVLEMLYEVGTHQGLEEARSVFDGLRNVRKDVTGQLLACCTSVKAVRLFLMWSRETGLLDVEMLQREYSPRVGSGARWMRRLDDGTLLSLKPLG